MDNHEELGVIHIWIKRKLNMPERDGQKVRKLQSRRDQLVSQLKPLEDEWSQRAEDMV